jgi:hypothetical protein
MFRGTVATGCLSKLVMRRAMLDSVYPVSHSCGLIGSAEGLLCTKHNHPECVRCCAWANDQQCAFANSSNPGAWTIGTEELSYVVRTSQVPRIVASRVMSRSLSSQSH